MNFHRLESKVWLGLGRVKQNNNDHNKKDKNLYKKGIWKVAKINEDMVKVLQEIFI